MALRLILVRHAETGWNRERRYQGWTDTALSEAGRRQADAAAHALSGAALAAVWTSPLARGRDTAAAIATPHGLPVKVDEAFREMRFGPWEGLTVSEVGARFPDAYRAWVETPHLAAWEGAETLGQVRERVLGGLARLRRAHDDRTVCLVAHEIPSRILILAALGLGLERIWSVYVSSTGLSELEFRDDWTALHRMNTLVHLEAVPTVG